jgi:hypothetical protein
MNPKSRYHLFIPIELKMREHDMRTNIYSALVALTIITSSNVYAIPPVPPSPAQEAPLMIICKDTNALTVEEIDLLNEDTDRIISFDQELREVCFKK